MYVHECSRTYCKLLLNATSYDCRYDICMFAKDIYGDEAHIDCYKYDGTVSYTVVCIFAILCLSMVIARFSLCRYNTRPYDRVNGI